MVNYSSKIIHNARTRTWISDSVLHGYQPILSQVTLTKYLFTMVIAGIFSDQRVCKYSLEQHFQQSSSTHTGLTGCLTGVQHVKLNCNLKQIH